MTDQTPDAIIQAIADRSAKRAVRDMLLLLGIDADDPIEAQKQFAILRELAQPRTLENLKFLDAVNSAKEKAVDVSWRTAVKMLVGAIIGLVVVMTREYWQSHIGWK